MFLINNRAPFLCYFKLCASFRSHWSIQTGDTVQKHSIRVKFGDFFLSHLTLKFGRWPWKTIAHFFCATSSFVHHFIAISQFKLDLQPRNAQFRSKSMIFCSCVTWHWRMTLKNKSTSSMPLQSLSIISQPSVKFKLELLSGNAPFGSISVIFVPGDLEVRKMTSKNNRAPLLCYFKLCASFHSQTEVTIGNAQIGSKLVLTSVTLTTDFWPWPFAWTSLS